MFVSVGHFDFFHTFCNKTIGGVVDVLADESVLNVIVFAFLIEIPYVFVITLSVGYK